MPVTQFNGASASNLEAQAKKVAEEPDLRAAARRMMYEPSPPLPEPPLLPEDSCAGVGLELGVVLVLGLGLGFALGARLGLVLGFAVGASASVGPVDGCGRTQSHIADIHHVHALEIVYFPVVRVHHPKPIREPGASPGSHF